MKVGLLTRQRMVEEYKNRIKKIGCLFFINFKGINADGMTQIRNKLREVACNIMVVKNSIFRRTLIEMKMEFLLNYLEGELAVVYGRDDPISITKRLKELNKAFEGFKVKVGLIEGKLLEEKEINKLASIPSREALFTQVVSLIKVPITNFVFSLKANIQGLVNLLNQIKEKGNFKEGGKE